MKMYEDTFILLGVRSKANKSGQINYTVSFATNNTDLFGFQESDGFEASTCRLEKESDFYTLKSFKPGDVLSGILVRENYKLVLKRLLSHSGDDVFNVFEGGDSD